MHVSSDQFLEAFKNVWRERQSDDAEELWGAFQGNTSWTNHMMHRDGFLRHVCNRLPEPPGSLSYYTELYTIDAVFVGGVDLFRPEQRHAYPSELHVLVEHENGPNPEEEMWKLLHWRCPLKVLIFYDYPEDANTPNALTKWATDRLEKLNQMRTAVAIFQREPSYVTYLFVIGQTTLDKSIRWWCATDDSPEPVRFVVG